VNTQWLAEPGDDWAEMKPVLDVINESFKAAGKS
jgi:hypothetical protein